jgi:glycosyltransferase involved in cell wall biosynthesis
MAGKSIDDAINTVPVSVVIPTFNGGEQIRNVIDALKKQSFRDFEIIVVNDGSTNNTKNILEEIKINNTNIKIFEQPNKGRASSRNLGAANAQGHLLVFYDDDVRPVEESIKKHVEFHEKYPQSICGGNLAEDESLIHSDFQLFKLNLSWKWVEKYHPGLNLLNKGNMFLSAANFSISKELFRIMEGFDERLKDAEDYDLAIRTIKKDRNVFFDKSNLAYHDDFITCGGYIRRIRQYNEWQKKLHLVNPDLYESTGIKDWNPSVLKKIVFSAFSHKRWVSLIDKDLIRWLPRKIRFRLYDFVITGLGRIFPEREI